MCRPCSEALESTKEALEEITDRLRADEYDIHSLPSDLKISFKVLEEMARMMHLSGLDSDIEDLSKAIMDQVEPIHTYLADSTIGVQS